ncbi:transient receptor potential cation channel subfamily A member 1-like [Liolophura sinensis]|uniref:transient receptor potential cation channel subfamily A member 1-like n=1 Tax=Liolophura sinensis TaxID=3198878 RepID=UPI00315987E8
MAPRYPSRLRNSALLGTDVATRNSMQKLEAIPKDAFVKPVKEGKWKALSEKTQDSGQTNGAVCLIQHSPYRILKIAAKGDIAEFEKLYTADHSRLHIRDQRGQGTLHYAASKGRVVVMEFILNHGGDLDARDNKGNTPLHRSVEGMQKVSIEYLVRKGANTTVCNNKYFTPLILAIDLAYVDIVECLLKQERVNPEDPGENGATPLHYCTYKDEYKCAGKLLENGAKLQTKCHNAFYPIHTAAYHASVKTMQVLLDYGEASGYTREKLLKLTDREGNNPLHAAVTSGDLEAVRVCLQAGASAQAQQEEKLTPVHFAASQGALEILDLMFELCGKSMGKAVDMKDSLGMTPLHKASIFNHENVVRCLLDHGADINCEDNLHRTPLMTAAAKSGWNTVRYLIQRGAQVHLKDEQSRNFLHHAIKSGGRLHQFGYDLIINVKNLLNEKDDLGCTPLHYASKEGYLSAIEDLISLGAMLNPKNNERQSPFHFAARYGRYNTCLRLLDSEQGPNIINESDNTGLTALHIAAENGHAKILSLLMQRGAAVHRDFNGNTPLHLAATNGYTHSMRLLLNVHSNLLDCKNKEGGTALHLAAQQGHVSAITLLLSLGTKMSRNAANMTFFDFILDNRHNEAAIAVVTHPRWSEVMCLWSNKYVCTMIGLIQQLPEITIVVLDQCQTYSEHDTKDKQFHITYNFKHLHCPVDPDAKKQSSEDSHMSAVNAMVKFGRVDCLSHPVCVSYLQMKWNGCGMWFHFIYLAMYLVFLGLLTSFAISNPARHHKETTLTPLEAGTNQSYNNFQVNDHIELTVFSKISAYVLLIFCVLSCFKEIGQMLQQKWRYFQYQSNAMEWTLLLTTSLYIAPFLAHKSVHFQYEAGTIAVFISWFNLLHYLQRFDFFGIYVVMFLAILSTLLQVLCVFSILIVAFGLAFYMLMARENSKAYSTPGLSMLRTAMMMLELDYMDSFNLPYVDGNPQTLHFNNLTLFMLVLFVLLMPILLMNLLIGLAVGDIEAVQRDARLKRLAMQVEHHTDLESKLPKRILKMVNKDEYKVYPNRGQQWLMSLLLKMTSSLENGPGQLESYSRGAFVNSSQVYEELSKQKHRMKEISNTLNKQNDLLRLIVQKMDINTSSDYRDEGDCDNEAIENIRGHNSTSGRNWTRNNVIKQTSTINAWKRQVTKS